MKNKETNIPVDYRKKLETLFENQAGIINKKSLLKILKKKIALLENSLIEKIELKTTDVLVQELEREFLESESSHKILLEIDKILNNTYKKIIYEHQSISIK